MQQGGEQPQQRRRSRVNLGNPEPISLLHPKGSGKTVPSPKTDAYSADEALLDSPRQNTSVVRYDSPAVQRITGSQLPHTTVPHRRQQGTRNLPRSTTRTTGQATPSARPARPERKNIHWLLPLGIGMLAMLAVWVTGSWVLAWGMQRYNDIRYGVPRTFQTDAVVGHEDSKENPSHFMAVNLNRQAIVIEFKGGDPTKSVSYVAPFYIAGEQGELAPVTVEFRDVAGDDKPDMIIRIHLPNRDELSIFINEGKNFRPSNGDDKIRIER